MIFYLKHLIIPKLFEEKIECEIFVYKEKLMNVYTECEIVVIVNQSSWSNYKIGKPY